MQAGTEDSTVVQSKKSNCVDLRDPLAVAAVKAVILDHSDTGKLEGYVNIVGRKMGLGALSLGRYLNNKNGKGRPLGNKDGALDKQESKIKQYAIQHWTAVRGQSNAPSLASSTAVKFTKRDTPLMSFNSGNSGTTMIMDLATSYNFPEGVTASDWEFSMQRSDIVVQLRSGLRGRHWFSKSSNSDLAGKLFEWRIAVDT